MLIYAALFAPLFFVPLRQEPLSPEETKAPELALGPWRAELESAGGALPFGLEIEKTESDHVAWIVNGAERIRIPSSRVQGEFLVLSMDHYQSRITAKIGSDGRSLEGTWTKVGSGKDMTRMPFSAEWGVAPRFALEEGDIELPKVDLDGRWSVSFSSSKERAVGLFATRPDGTASGTFMTSLGDYRYLAGSYVADQLQLSCFDGAHAFLFKATMSASGVLRGDFWSRDTWHESWSATLDPEAQLPDPLGISHWKPDVSIDSLSFYDPTAGEMRSLGHESLAGRVRLIQLFGTWCPNCHDEAPFLADLWREYRDEGLQIVGLAFEHSGEPKRDSVQLSRFRERHQIPFPTLLGGVSQKDSATKMFGGLEQVIAYPTVLFVDAKGAVRYVHTGFSGPATGAAHEREKERFHELVRELLSEKK